MRTESNVVHWAHPSVRDLVIDALVQDRDERKRFLAHAGVNGLVLALSSAGGISGERERPLLVDSTDWSDFTHRVQSFLASARASEYQALLAALAASASRLGPSSTPPEVELLMRSALDAATHRWSEEGKPLSVALVRYFFEISLPLDPPPQGPALHPTWKEHWDRFRALASGDISTDELERAGDFLLLVQVLKRYDPRTIEREGFPSLYKAAIKDVADAVSTWVESLPDVDPDEKDSDEAPTEPGWDEESEAEALEEAQWLLDHLATVDGIEAPALADVADVARNKESDRRKRAEAFGEMQAYDDEGDYERGGGGWHSGSGESVEAIFRDLV